MKTKQITFGGVLLAIAILLPQVLHLSGIQSLGQVLLPMHIPVLIAGFTLGPLLGGLIGIIAPIVSFLITGMPAADRLIFMIIELGVYGFATGFFYHNIFNNKGKLRVFIVLAISLILGRVAYAVSVLVITELLELSNLGIAYLVKSLSQGLLGVAVQFLIIPPIIYAIEKNGFLVKVIKTKEK